VLFAAKRCVCGLFFVQTNTEEVAQDLEILDVPNELKKPEIAD
jgi:hypothetical protein